MSGRVSQSVNLPSASCVSTENAAITRCGNSGPAYLAIPVRGSYHDMKCLNVLTAIQATELQITTLQINNGRSLGTPPVIT
jgi:hypothetical protein